MKREHFNSALKRVSGYIKYRKYKNHRYNLKELLSYRKSWNKTLKEEGFYDWDCTLTDGEDEL